MYVGSCKKNLTWENKKWTLLSPVYISCISFCSDLSFGKKQKRRKLLCLNYSQISVVFSPVDFITDMWKYYFVQFATKITIFVKLILSSVIMIYFSEEALHSWPPWCHSQREGGHAERCWLQRYRVCWLYQVHKKKSIGNSW